MTGPVCMLRPGVLDTLRAAADAELPIEACALLLGQARRGTVVVRAVRVFPRCGTTSGFQIAEQDVSEALAAAAGDGLLRVGLFHTHPTASPRPSGRDVTAGLRRGGIQLIFGAPHWDFRAYAPDPLGRFITVPVHEGE